MIRSTLMVAMAMMFLLVSADIVRAQVREKQKDVSEGDKAVSRALAKEGHEKLKEKQYEVAEHLLQQALQKDPFNSSAVYDLAEICNRTGKGQEAIRLYRRYLKSTADEGKTSERVMARIYLRKLDRQYGEMENRKTEVVEAAGDLLNEHGDELSKEQVEALEAVVSAFGGETGREKEGGESSD